MKKSFFIIVFSIMMLFSSLVCNAQTADATLKVDYEYISESNLIKVDANFVDIKAKEGIITIEYDITYDANALELVSYKTYFPKDWEQLLENETVEDFTEKTQNGKIRWVFVVIAVGKGAKNDAELGINLEFKPLKDGTANVSFNYKDIGTEILKNGMTESLEHISGNSVNIAIDLSKPAEPEIDDGSITVPENNTTSSTESKEEASSNSVEGNDGNVSMPSVLGTESSESSTHDVAGGSNMLLWVIIGVGVVGIAVVVAVVLKTKKG